jgi:hypothetical protein
MDADQYYYVAISSGYEDYSNNAGTSVSATFKTISTTTGLEENQKSFLKVYPNPGTGLFNLEFTNQNPKRLTVTDMSGITVYDNSTVSGGSLQLDLSHEREGIYFLHVKEEITGTINVIKLIKQNGRK